MKECPRCNKRLYDGVIFCFICGALENEIGVKEEETTEDEITTSFITEEEAEARRDQKNDQNREDTVEEQIVKIEKEDGREETTEEHRDEIESLSHPKRNWTSIFHPVGWILILIGTLVISISIFPTMIREMKVKGYIKAGYEVLKEDGQYQKQKAIEEFEKVLEIDPNNQEAREGIKRAKKQKESIKDHLEAGKVYIKSGLYDNAIEEFKKVKELLKRPMSNKMKIEIEVLENLLRRRGMDFKPTDEVLSEFRELGADDTFIKAIIDYWRKNTRRLIIETDPPDATATVITVKGEDGKKEGEGKTPLTLELKQGDYIVGIEKDGYMSEAKKVSLICPPQSQRLPITLTSLPPPPPPKPLRPTIEFAYNYSERYIITNDNVEALVKNKIGISRFHYWLNNRFALFFDIGGVKTALSDSGEFGDINLGYGGGMRWITFSSPSLDLKGEAFYFKDEQDEIGSDILSMSLNRQITWLEYQAVGTMTYKSLRYLRPFISVLFSKIDSNVRYLNNING